MSELGSEPPYPRRRQAFGFLLLASAMNLIDLTIVNISIPSIRSDLGSGQSATEWILAAYGLAFGMGLISGGRLGDIYGRRRLFSIGVGGFVLASALCGAAPDLAVLIAGRALQAGFAAMMMPQVLSSIGVLFPLEERFKAMAMYGATIGLATVSGPLVGAALIQLNAFGVGWRSVFWINAPLGVIALIGARWLLPESRGQASGQLDLPGVAALSLALVLILYPLSEGQSLGWPAWTFALMAAGVVVLGWFVASQRARSRTGALPLLPPSLFSQRAFSGGLAFNLAFFSGVPGYSLVLMLTLQQGLRFGPLHAAFTVLPFSVGIAAAARNVMKLLPKFSGFSIVRVGTGVLACGLAINLVVVHLARGGLTNWELLGGSLVSGIGMGLVTPVLTGTILSGVNPADAGVAAGVLSTATQVGGAIGVAIVGAIFFGGLPSPAAIASDPGHAYTGALVTVLVYQVALYVVALVVGTAMLPRPARRPAPAPAAPAPLPAKAPAPAEQRSSLAQR